MRSIWVLLTLFLFAAPVEAQQALDAGPPRGIACAYNPTLPTLSAGTIGWVQCDSSGRLIISNPGGGGSGGGATGDVTNAGTSGTKAQAVQGVTGGVPLAVTWTGQTVSISGTVAVNNTQLGGTAIASGSGASNAGTQRVILATDNPTITIGGTVTANLGTLNGAATDTSVQQVKTALGSPFQAGGSVGNTAFGANQGTPATAANAWPMVPTQGGVAVSPSNPLPASETDGANAALGTTTDAAATSTSTSGTGIAWLRGLSTSLGYTNSSGYTGTGAANVVAILKGLYSVTVAPNGPVAPGTAAANSSLTGGVYNSTAPTLTSGQQAATQVDASGNLKTTVVGSGNALAVNSNGQAAAYLSVNTNTGGLASISRLTSSAATTNATVVKAAAGRMFKIRAYNTGSTLVRLKVYNKATAPTVGTDTPFDVFVLPPGLSTFDVSDIGWYLSAGISYALVTGAADSDATAPAAGAITDLSIGYQ